MKIIVTTPTGQIGSRVVERLLQTDAEVAVIARDPARLPAEVRSRAVVHQGSLEDGAVLRRATAGADALFLLIPPNYTTTDWAGFQLGIGRAAQAVRDGGVRRVVVLSSLGAHRDDLLAISRIGQVERLLGEVAPDVTALRAGFFFENFLSAVPTIQDHGTIYMSLSPDTRFAMVATRDIGDAAADLLLDTAWSGHRVQELQGAADLTPAEAAGAIGAGIGRSVSYVQVSEEQARQALLAGGASEHVAAEYARLFTGLDRHAADHEPRTAGTTTPTTLEQWAREVMRPLVAEAAPAAV